MSYNDEIASLSPVGHWKLDEISGTQAADASGNGYHGTYINTPSLNQTGLIETDSNDKAVLFDSALTQGVDIPYNSVWNVDGITICTWVKTSTAGKNVVNRADTGDYSWQISASPSNITTSQWTSNGSDYRSINTGRSVIADEVVFIAVYFSSAVTRIYINGYLCSTDSASSGVWGSNVASGISISKRGDEANYRSGEISDVTFFDKELTAAQILTLYEAGRFEKRYEEYIMEQLPATYYLLNDAVSSTTFGSNIDGQNLTVVGTPTFQQTGLVEPNVSKSILLDGSTDGAWADCPSSLKVQSFTFEAVVKLDAAASATRQTLVCVNPKGSTASSKGAYLTTTTSYLPSLRLGDGTTITDIAGTTDIRDGVHHIAGTYDGTTAKIYVDGEEENSATFTGPVDYTDSGTGPTTGQLSIGGLHTNVAGTGLNDEWFDGEMAHIAHYDSVLTPAEIREHAKIALYRGHTYDSKISELPILSRWKLDETNGTLADDSVGTDDGTYVSGNVLGKAGPIKSDSTSRMVSFEGTNDATTGIVTSFTLTQRTEWAISAWIYVDAGDPTNTYGYIINASQHNAAAYGNLPFRIFIGETANLWDVLYIAYDDGVGDYTSNITHTKSVIPGTFYHIVCNYKDSDKVETYINGVLLQSDTITWTMSDPGYSLTFGRPAVTNSGGIDTKWLDQAKLGDVVVFSRMLTPTEIAGLYYAASTSTITYASIDGTITVDGAASFSKVRAYDTDTGELAGEARTNQTTGDYTIVGLMPNASYTIVAEPPTGSRPLAHGPVAT